MLTYVLRCIQRYNIHTICMYSYVDIHIYIHMYSQDAYATNTTIGTNTQIYFFSNCGFVRFRTYGLQIWHKKINNLTPCSSHFILYQTKKISFFENYYTLYLVINYYIT